jgi:uncharacterized cupin superfamily protein
VQREGGGFYCIIEDTLDVIVGDGHFILGLGDSIHFDQRHCYKMTNMSPDPVRILWVGAPALFG